MATTWCPSCGNKLRRGAVSCSHCGWAQDESLPSPTAQTAPSDRGAQGDRGARGDVDVFTRDDVLVELARFGGFKAEVIAAQLRSAGVPAAVFGVGTAGLLSAVQFSEGSRVMVRRIDLSAAQELTRALLESEGFNSANEPLSDVELGDLAEAAALNNDLPDNGAVV